MNKKQKEKFKEIIEEGKWNYVTKYGLRWGAIMFFFFILWDKFIMEYEIDTFNILLNFIIWGIAGLIIGLWGWKNVNKKFKEK